MGQELAKYGWTTFAVLEMSHASLSVLLIALEQMTVVILKISQPSAPLV